MSGYIGSTPVPQATQHRESFTCTEGQTTFNTAGYTAQFVDVYLNGSHLSPADFTATNGSDVVLAVAASADDVCDIISYTPFEVADATFTGDFKVDGTTFNVDSSNNRIGVGTASPASDLHLVSSTSGDPEIRIEGSGTANGIITFLGSGHTNPAVGLRYISSGDSVGHLAFFANGTSSSTLSERFRISADGSLSTPTAGTSNVRFGVNAGNSILDGGNYNVCVGDEAGTTLSTGDDSVLIGYAAGDAISTGTQNVAIGSNALGTGVTATNNVAVGRASMAATLGSENTAVGVNTLAANQGGSHSVAIGSAALTAQNPSSGNVDFHNVAVGSQAGKAINTGIQNVLIGGLAGDALTTGSSNVAVGYAALTSDDVGQHNVAIGREALSNQNISTAANTYNTAVGSAAGQTLSTGQYNTLIGGLCADSMQTNDEMTAVGYNLAATSQTGRAREIVIGSNGTGGGSNTARFITSGGSATLNIDGSDTSWAAASDSRLKKEVANSTVGLEFIKDLRPVTFKWNAKNAIADSLPQYDADSSDPVYGEGKAHHGFIAQEVKTVIDAHSDVVNGHNIWVEDPNGTQQVAPSALVPMLVKAIQEQNALIEALTVRVTELEG